MSGAHHGKCVIYKYLGFNIFVCSIKINISQDWSYFAHRQESETMLSFEGQQLMSHWVCSGACRH